MLFAQGVCPTQFSQDVTVERPSQQQEQEESRG